MNRFDSWYLGAQRAGLRRPYRVMAGAALLLVTAAAGLGRTTLDLSFQPLFASGDETAAPTREFESVFGQASGAWITVVIEAPGMPAADLLRTLAVLSSAARQVDGISEVVSITDLRVPQWQLDEPARIPHRFDGLSPAHCPRIGAGCGLGFVAPLPAALLAPGAEAALERQYRALLDGSRFVGWLVSADGSRLLLGARIDLPLADVDGRRGIVREFERRLKASAPAGVGLHFSGISVVELAYEAQILRDQAIATAATAAVLALLLAWCFGNNRAVLVCLLPVSAAVPATLGLMGWLGQPVTIINTVIPALVMVIGVADGVHMLLAWTRARRSGLAAEDAVHAMLETTGRACFLTTITTMAGFLALQTADLAAVAAFGSSAALGVLIAWLSNQLLLPPLLARLDVGVAGGASLAARCADRAIAASLYWALRRPRYVVGSAALATLGCLLAMPALDIDQRFNEELPAEHPVSRAQALLEKDFGGFLGPEISIRRTDGGSVIDEDAFRRLQRFVAGLRQLPHTSRAWSIDDLLPPGASPAARADVVAALREHRETAGQVRELVDAGQTRLAVIVRTGDIGTREAARYREQIERLIITSWNDDYDVEIVGQWWLAQHGMSLLLRDMLTSVATAALMILPVLWLVIGERRLRCAALAANLLPLLLPLAFMAISGITLRIGTVVVMAVSLGLIVDNTLHIVLRLADRRAGDDLRRRLEMALHESGRAVLFTSLALVGAFASMLFNELQAIRDMGLVAAVTFTGALFADLLVLPAVYVLLEQGTGSAAAPPVSRRSAPQPR